VDEPFYAFYLKHTGKDHPGAAEIMVEGETSWQKVVDQLQAPPSRPDISIFYQKQMTHHLLPQIDRTWLASVTNCFLIRDPAEVICSYLKQNGEPTLEDLGFVQQAEIFDFVRQAEGKPPPVIDANDVLRDPERILRLLCQAIHRPFEEAMLSWPPGLRETDGSWAAHWYGSVALSTGFQPYHERNEVVPDRLQDVHARCREYYERLYRYRLH